MPEPPVDFNGLMADVQKMQQVLAQIHGSLTQPRQKEVLGELLGKIEQARSDAETAYPNAVKTIRDSAENTVREATQLKAENDAKRAEVAKLQEQQQPPPPKPTIRRPSVATLPPITVEPGSLLRKEILQRFGGVIVKKAASDDREIWEDWSWE